MTREIEKGQHGKLNVTQKARHRVMAGLAWDPADQSSVIEKVGDKLKGKAKHHDLDLGCFTYDAHNVFISAVNADRAMNVDESGKIYHSGDNIEGFGDGDDEQLSVELKDLDPAIHHIIFLAKIQTGHNFSEIKVPEIRLADGFDNKNFLHTMIDHEDGQDKDVFIFAHIYRTGDGWNLHNVSEYLSTRDHDDWSNVITNHLKTK